MMQMKPNSFVQNCVATSVTAGLLWLSSTCGGVAAELAAVPALVPWPHTFTLGEGSMPLSAETRIMAADSTLLPLAKILSGEIAAKTGLKLAVAEGTAKPGAIGLSLDPHLKKEHYQLTVSDQAQITGGDYNAVAMGTVTLLQAITTQNGKQALPKLTIEDHPHFEYCGTMFDIARKPYSMETLKQIVDICRLYKIRYVQLHMTDDNAFVFPSTAFPSLGSQNSGSLSGPAPTKYTLEEMKDLVAYGDARGVTFVPELEMPGHSGGLIAGMPEVFGTTDDDGKPLGIGMINIANERAYEVLDTLIGEISEVFKSSPYFHTGGDEVTMANLDRCPDIKQFAAKHKLDNLHQAINPFQARLRDIVTRHGKQMIAWDGYHAPKALPKDIIFMPWQHETPEAAHLVEKGYRVINAPWGVRSPYANPYQCNGALLKRGEPLLIGATSILWEAPQDRAIPFLRDRAALRNEPTYNPDAGRGHKDFVQRVAVTDQLAEQLLYGFTLRGEGLIDPTAFMQLATAFTDTATFSVYAPGLNGKVCYTLSDAEPTAESTVYTSPITVNESCTLKAQAFDNAGKPIGAVMTKNLRRVPAIKHAAIAAKVTCTPELQGSYASAGPAGLVDGFHSDGDDYTAAGWAGWLQTDVQIDIDLGKSIPIERLGGRFARGRFGLNLPKAVEFLVSVDGKEFQSIARIDEAAGARAQGWFSTTVSGVNAQFVRMKTTSGGEWTFIDEIAVNYEPQSPTLVHSAQGKTVKLGTPPSDSYNLPGIAALTDGYVARSTDFANPYWLGWEGKDVEATIDLGEVTEIRNVGIHTLRFVPAGIYFPGMVEVLVSDDGEKFTPVGKITPPVEERPEALTGMEIDLNGVRGRYVRVITHQQTWWTFLDEIYVNRK